MENLGSKCHPRSYHEAVSVLGSGEVVPTTVGNRAYSGAGWADVLLLHYDAVAITENARNNTTLTLLADMSVEAVHDVVLS